MGLIIISAILILVVSYLLISEFTIPRYEDNEKILFSSMNKASVNYTVLLKPNSLFEEELWNKASQLLLNTWIISEPLMTTIIRDRKSRMLQAVMKL